MTDRDSTFGHMVPISEDLRRTLLAQACDDDVNLGDA